MNTSWDDFRIAFQVAQSGSLSGAGKALGINHATVLRHINQLEQTLDVKLFIRHQRGYRLTDAGQLMMAEMPDIQRHFSSLENRLSCVEEHISGTLKITTVIGTYSPYLMPGLSAIRKDYPQLHIQVISTDDIIPLDQGAAHVSIRVGPKPNGSDLIVKPLSEILAFYYASHSYINTFGIPQSTDEFQQHQWVLPSAEKHHIPFIKAVLKHIDRNNIVYQSNHFPDVHSAVISGMGIGPVEVLTAAQHPELQRLNIDTDTQQTALWFVYHKDLKDSARIKTLYQYLRKSLG